MRKARGKTWREPARALNRNGEALFDELVVKKYKKHAFVVIELGSNLSAFKSMAEVDNQIDYIMRKIGKTNKAVFMTATWNPWDPEYQDNQPERHKVNERKHAMAQKYKGRMFLVDWEDYVLQKGNNGQALFVDRIHLTNIGYRQLQKMFTEQLVNAATTRFNEQQPNSVVW